MSRLSNSFSLNGNSIVVKVWYLVSTFLSIEILVPKLAYLTLNVWNSSEVSEKVGEKYWFHTN